MRNSSAFQPIRDLVEGCWPGEWGTDPISGVSNCIVYRATDIDDDGHLNLDGGAERWVPPAKIVVKSLRPDDLLLEAAGGAPDKPVGRVALVTASGRKPSLTSNFFRFIRPKQNVDARFLAFQLIALNRSSSIWRYQQQTTSLINLKVADYLDHKIWVPSPEVQRRTAAILTSIDTAIEKNEVLIDKYRQIKSGLMHDLFTRGVLRNGQLRPPRDQAPELYQETEIGWLPKEWKVEIAERVLESIADGPFGSNLKTEHYVTDAGVRVVRLQNISSYEYADGDKAYISAKHASFLIRNKVVGGDVLIAGLGDERYPVARACCYPDALPPAINKADCFRARCNTHIMSNMFFMLFLNSEIAQRQTRRYEQGVTRPRINTSNMKRLLVCMPELNEQKQFVAKFEAMQTAIHAKQANLEILRQQKLGLMHDLLTGKVEVKVEQDSVEAVNA
jgi:type I restriction enzyme S subunit